MLSCEKDNRNICLFIQESSVGLGIVSEVSFLYNATNHLCSRDV